MQYCSAPLNEQGQAVVAVVLPLSVVSLFDPRNPPPNTYGCDAAVQVGWVMSTEQQTLAWIPPGEVSPVQVSVPVFESPPAPADPTPEQRLGAAEQALQKTLDAMAQTRGYDSMASLCSYAGTMTGLQGRALTFQHEGNVGLAYRSQVWSNLYAAASSISVASTLVEAQQAAIATMPPLTWPDGATASPTAPTVLRAPKSA